MKKKPSDHLLVFYPDAFQKKLLVDKSTDDKRLKAIKALIEYAEILKRNAFEIRISDLGFSYFLIELELFKSYMQDLQTQGCFTSFKQNPFTLNQRLRFGFSGVNLTALYKAKYKREKELGVSFYDYDYEHKSLTIGDKGSINFKTKEGRKYQSTLFEILLEKWQANGEVEAEINKTEIRSEIKKRLKEDWDGDKLRSNLGHLENKIRTNPKIAALITFERHHKDYVLFNIKSN